MSISGLQPRTAAGAPAQTSSSARSDRYRLGVYAPASATLTPFSQLQASSVTQNAFTEAGAQRSA